MSCSTSDSALLLLGCAVWLVSGATSGGAATVSVDLSNPSLTASVPFDVWHPGALSLEVDDAELNLIEGCTTDRFEWTRLRLRSDPPDMLDMTPLLAAGDLGSDAGVSLSFVSSADGTSRVVVEGVTAGSADVWLSSQDTVRLTLSVRDDQTV